MNAADFEIAMRHRGFERCGGGAWLSVLPNGRVVRVCPTAKLPFDQLQQAISAVSRMEKFWGVRCGC